MSNKKKPETGLFAWSIEAVDATGGKPETLDDAHARVAYVFTEHPSEHQWQAKAINDFLSMYTDGDDGMFYRARMLRTLTEKFGPLNHRTILDLWMFARIDNWEKVSSRTGRQGSRKHSNQQKRAAFIEWAKDHISKGATPQNVPAIKRLAGFDKSWGVDETIKKWWRTINGAPPLKPGATRT